MDRGLLHLYTGDGKGKTTAALGLSLRARGRGKKVLWLSFLKDLDSGEFFAPPFDLFDVVPVRKFWFMMDEQEKRQVTANQNAALVDAFARAGQENYDLLVLDEAIGSVAIGALDEELLISRLTARPPTLEVVLTGRDPSPRLIELADYVSEIKKIKHPYDRQIPAREGIEH